VLAAGGVHRAYTGTIPRVSPLVLLDLHLARRRIDRLAKTVSTEAPWAAPAAATLDAQTFETWMRRHLRTPMARRLLTLTGRTVWGTEPAEMSALHVLFYVAGAGGIDRLIDTDGGAQQDRFEGTAHGVAAALARRLGDVVRLGEAVRAIEQTPEAVTVTASRARVRAKNVIVAIPPALTARIAFAPELPGLRRQLAQRLPLGALTKIQVLYDRPFWREAGLSGAAVTDQGPVSLTFDSSPSDGAAGVLTGFVGGDDARAFARVAAPERRAAVLAGLRALFGERAAQPADYAEQAWADEPWSGGGPTSNFGPGGWTGYGPLLRAPVGRVHWAGTETATNWSGYMEGALQSAQRVVAEVG
jgi:monoamine oxidase